MTRLFSHLRTSAHQCSKPGNSLSRKSRIQLSIASLEDRQMPSANPLSELTLVGSAPAAPSFTARALSTTQVSLSWNSVPGATGYLVDEWSNGGWSQIGSFDGNATCATVNGLSPNTTYYFDVAA